MKFKYISLGLLVVLFACVLACRASTFKPFVRSRYSLRWRKTTEAPKVVDSSTSAPKLESIAVTETSMKTFESTENVLPETTFPALVKSSTHLPDYDYYGNNEVEDNEHKP